MKIIFYFFISILLAFSALASNKLPQTGLASFYGDRANNHHTASWDRYCKDSFTAAHRTLPFGTYLKVTNLTNCNTVVVRVNDRGPHRRHRIIDLSGAAADMLGIRRSGVAKVTIELATIEEIKNFREKYIDSVFADTVAFKDSCCTIPVRKIHPNVQVVETFRIQGGAYRTMKGAEKLKKYLNDNCITLVTVKCKKARRHRIYKVIIGPVNNEEKDNALKVLKNKGISGWIIRS